MGLCPQNVRFSPTFTTHFVVQKEYKDSMYEVAFGYCQYGALAAVSSDGGHFGESSHLCPKCHVELSASRCLLQEHKHFCRETLYLSFGALTCVAGTCTVTWETKP